MQVSVEQLEGLERRMTVQVPATSVEQEIQNRLQALIRKVRVDGFRPGKVPLKLVKRLYGAQVRQEVLGEKMKESLHDALAQENLQPVGESKVEPVNLDEGANLEYQVTFEILPEFTPQSIAGLKIVRPLANVVDDDIDNMIDNLRKQRTIWIDVERPAQMGDRVTISFAGKLDGEDFPGGKGDNAHVVLGEGGMVEDFEKQLYGVTKDCEYEIDVRFPDDYPGTKLAGQSVHFSVQVHSVAEPSLPEIDEAFAVSFGVEEGGIEGLRQALRESLERELHDGVNNDMKQQAMQALLDVNDILVPQALVKGEIENLARQAGFPESDDDTDTEETAATKAELFEEQAKRRVALGLIIAKLASTHELKPDPMKVQERLERIAASYQDSDDVIQWYRKNPKMMEGVSSLVLEDRVIEWLLQDAEVEDKTMTFDEVMKPQQTKAAVDVVE